MSVCVCGLWREERSSFEGNINVWKFGEARSEEGRKGHTSEPVCRPGSKKTSTPLHWNRGPLPRPSLCASVRPSHPHPLHALLRICMFCCRQAGRRAGGRPQPQSGAAEVPITNTVLALCSPLSLPLSLAHTPAIISALFLSASPSLSFSLPTTHSLARVANGNHACFVLSRLSWVAEGGQWPFLLADLRRSVDVERRTRLGRRSR